MNFSGDIWVGFFDATIIAYLRHAGSFFFIATPHSQYLRH